MKEKIEEVIIKKSDIEKIMTDFMSEMVEEIYTLLSERSRLNSENERLRKVLAAKRDEHLTELNHRAFQTPGVVEYLDCFCELCLALKEKGQEKA